MFKSILIPVDLTPKNVGTLEVAQSLALLAGGRITLLHVIETINLPAEELRDFYRRLEEKAFAKMTKLAESLTDAGVDVERRVAYGSRSAEIVNYADDNKIDLIVLSSHRIDPANPTQNWASLSHKVAILSPCPVLLVK